MRIATREAENELDSWRLFPTDDRNVGFNVQVANTRRLVERVSHDLLDSMRFASQSQADSALVYLTATAVVNCPRDGLPFACPGRILRRSLWQGVAVVVTNSTPQLLNLDDNDKVYPAGLNVSYFNYLSVLYAASRFDLGVWTNNPVLKEVKGSASSIVSRNSEPASL